ALRQATSARARPSAWPQRNGSLTRQRRQVASRSSTVHVSSRSGGGAGGGPTRAGPVDEAGWLAIVSDLVPPFAAGTAGSSRISAGIVPHLAWPVPAGERL